MNGLVLEWAVSPVMGHEFWTAEKVKFVSAIRVGNVHSMDTVKISIGSSS